jgi:hypothetical protein
LRTQEETEADKKLIAVYGDTIHRNDGRHLSGGIVNDKAMQMLYDNVVSYPHPMYLPPKGKVGNRFIVMYTAEMRKVRDRKTNSECAMIFPACVLRRETEIIRAREIRRRIER